MRPSHLIAAALNGAATLASAQTPDCGCNTSSTAAATATLSMTTVPWTVTYTTTVPSGFSSYDATATAPAPNSTASAFPTVSTNHASPVDGLSGDSSVLGLVIFFALSLCLL